MKSLEFFKPTLATTLAIILTWLLSVGVAQAGGYTVTLRQVGPNVVATGSGVINLNGLTFVGSNPLNPAPSIRPHSGWVGASIVTGPTATTMTDQYGNFSGPTSFGSVSVLTSASSGSGDIVGMFTEGRLSSTTIIVPKGYVSGAALSDSATYNGKTFATLGVTPGTYVWTWGRKANQNFTLQILPGPHISNFSTRADVGTIDNVAIAGFIITGTGPKSVVVRGIGPTLARYNVPGVLADPFLSLRDGSGNVLYENNNWKEPWGNYATQQTQIQNLGLACAGNACGPPNALESAILQTLPPGKYTAILSGSNGTTGVGLVEVYDVSAGVSAELTNVSTRGFVGTGDNRLIAGFIASGGNGSTQVVVRGLGPTLAQPQFGVSGTLVDPVVTLVDGNGNVVQTNNNWRDTQPAAISATGKAPPNDLEAAILAPVSAGNYTAVLSGNGGGTGIGLLEVYKQ